MQSTSAVASDLVAMAKHLLAAVLVLLVIAAASACSVPPSSCTKARCAALASPLTQTSKPVGFWYGIWNNVSWPDKAAANTKRGGPYVNYDSYDLGDLHGERSDRTLAVLFHLSRDHDVSSR